MKNTVCKSTSNQANIKLVAAVMAFVLLSSVLIPSVLGETSSKEKIKTTDKKEKTSKVVKQTPVKELKNPPAKLMPANTTAQSKASVDPLQAQKLACKQKETEREQYECEKALRSAQTSNDFKQKSKKYVVGPITFYYPGAKVEKSGSTDILNLKFLVENTGSKDNVALYCTGPVACNYDISDGKTTYKYAANDFTSGQIVLKPGMSRELNIMFGPAIGYGSYVPFKYDPSKQYTFNVKEPWGSSGIPLELK